MRQNQGPEGYHSEAESQDKYSKRLLGARFKEGSETGVERGEYPDMEMRLEEGFGPDKSQVDYWNQANARMMGENNRPGIGEERHLMRQPFSFTEHADMGMGHRMEQEDRKVADHFVPMSCDTYKTASNKPMSNHISQLLEPLNSLQKEVCMPSPVDPRSNFSQGQTTMHQNSPNSELKSQEKARLFNQKISEAIRNLNEAFSDPELADYKEIFMEKSVQLQRPVSQQVAEDYFSVGKQLIENLKKMTLLSSINSQPAPSPQKSPNKSPRTPIKKTPSPSEDLRPKTTPQEQKIKKKRGRKPRPKPEESVDCEETSSLLRKRDSSKGPDLLSVYREEPDIKWLLKLEEFLISKFSDGCADSVNLNALQSIKPAVFWTYLAVGYFREVPFRAFSPEQVIQNLKANLAKARMRIQLKITSNQLDAYKKEFDLFEDPERIPGIFGNTIFRTHFYQKHLSGDQTRFIPTLEMFANFQTGKLQEINKVTPLSDKPTLENAKKSVNQASCDEMISYFQSELVKASKANEESLEVIKETLPDLRASNLLKEPVSVLSEIHERDPLEEVYWNYMRQKKKNGQIYLGEKTPEEKYRMEWEEIIRTKDLCSKQAYVEKALCQVCNEDQGMTDSDFIVFCSRCNVGVHKCCYGLKTIPPENEHWYCQPCQKTQNIEEMARFECNHCLLKLGPMVQIPNDQKRFDEFLPAGLKPSLSEKPKWIHGSCLNALKTPKNKPDEVLRSVCIFCKVPSNYCTSCIVSDCEKTFHAECARRHGLSIEKQKQLTNEGVYPIGFYCKDHEPSESDMRASRESWSAAIQKAVKMIQQFESNKVEEDKTKDHDKLVRTLNQLKLEYFRGFLPEFSRKRLKQLKMQKMLEKNEFQVKIMKKESKSGSPKFVYDSLASQPAEEEQVPSHEGDSEL